MQLTMDAIKQTAQFLREKGFEDPRTGIIMGTGLGAMAARIENPIILSYSDIPHFPVSTVEFHKGNLLYGTIGSVKVMAMQGRFHYYEGYSMQEITFPVRVMKELGVQELFVSNVAGGINTHFKKGDLILIDDHINLLPDNPLRGLSDPAFGQRFTDMCEPYAPHLKQLLQEAAALKGIELKKGVYVAVQGPNLETKAEYRFLRNAGADMVGMSTIPEIIVANQLQIACAAISVITDECDPDNLKPVNIKEIIEIAGKCDIVLSDLFEDVIRQL
ncbi:MAG: purine-nucleoside phosphorylase [Bacteroidetes bacterium]|nr:purine-nucleoside phosphorylase [Bacteroidota bacterium]